MSYYSRNVQSRSRSRASVNVAKRERDDVVTSLVTSDGRLPFRAPFAGRAFFVPLHGSVRRWGDVVKLAFCDFYSALGREREREYVVLQTDGGARKDKGRSKRPTGKIVPLACSYVGSR